MIEVLVFTTRDRQFRARFRVEATGPWRFTGKWPQRWMVWQEIEGSLQMNNVR
jgi:hypothetical protein